jgi:hypothetical protein
LNRDPVSLPIAFISLPCSREQSSIDSKVGGMSAAAAARDQSLLSLPAHHTEQQGPYVKVNSSAFQCDSANGLVGGDGDTALIGSFEASQWPPLPLDIVPPSSTTTKDDEDDALSSAWDVNFLKQHFANDDGTSGNGSGIADKNTSTLQRRLSALPLLVNLDEEVQEEDVLWARRQTASVL